MEKIFVSWTGSSSNQEGRIFFYFCSMQPPIFLFLHVKLIFTCPTFLLRTVTFILRLQEWHADVLDSLLSFHPSWRFTCSESYISLTAFHWNQCKAETNQQILWLNITMPCSFINKMCHKNVYIRKARNLNINEFFLQNL